jgi:hypothetical protein
MMEVVAFRAAALEQCMMVDLLLAPEEKRR